MQFYETFLAKSLNPDQKRGNIGLYRGFFCSHGCIVLAKNLYGRFDIRGIMIHAAVADHMRFRTSAGEHYYALSDIGEDRLADSLLRNVREAQ